MNLRNLLFLLILLLVACTPVQVIITATPGSLPTDAVSATVEPSATPVPVLMTPTQEVSEHQRCAITHMDCYVNVNPSLIDGIITHTMWGGRNLDVPQGYRPKISASPSPFVYCYAWMRGCQFEFQWLGGSWGYQTEDVTLYPDTVYIVKMVYTINANCAPGNTCDLSNLSVGSNVYLNDRPTILTPQPVANRTGEEQESVWAIRITGDENQSVIAAIQTYLNVQWAVFAEPAKFTIHEIGIIAQPDNFMGYVFPIVRN